MTPLRKRMIEDMTLAGLSARTQTLYVQAVRALAAHYRRSPGELSEEEVRGYLLTMRERGAARGTFKVSHYGLQFLFRETLNRPWPLFTKKRSECPGKSVCPRRSPMPRLAVFWLPSAIRSTRAALA
jgi:hypothetical protein